MSSYPRSMSSEDDIDRLVAQWREARPDIDPGVMAESARLVRIGRLLTERQAARAREAGLDVGQGDVLFTLRRSGPPFRLSPTELARRTLVTTGTMTNRLDRLESRGLVRRLPDPDDGRGLAVELTEAGVAVVDDALPGHVAALEETFAALSDRERAQLVRLTRKLLARLESGG